MTSPDVRALIRTPGGESTAEIPDPDRGETEERIVVDSCQMWIPVCRSSTVLNAWRPGFDLFSMKEPSRFSLPAGSP